jgi:flagellar motor protein MotB
LVHLRFISLRKGAAVISGLLLLPALTLAQSAVTAATASLSSATTALPDAPVPLDPQSAPPQSQTQTPTQPAQQQPQQTNKQTTPPAQGNQPSLGDLGFTPQQTQANAQLQARLNKRTHDLKVHQTLGLITLAPLVATVAVSGGATQKHNHNVPGSPLIEPGSAGVDLHAALGSTTVALYAATAWYAIRAPKIPGTKPKGAIRLHRDLVWIHAPGMILTPILGGMALDQENKNEKIHGIASAHAYVAWTTVGAYAASAVSISWPLHLKFWEH